VCLRQKNLRMNCSKAFSVSLKDQVRAQVGLWNYQATPEDEINHHDSFRELLTSRTPLCRIDSQYINQIEVIVDEQRYHSSLSKDFHSNYIRIQKLFETCTNPDCIEHTPAAWNLVTSYYTSFFCASEFLRLQGHHILFLTEEDIHQIKSISSTSTAHLEQGSYTTSVCLDSTEGFRIVLRKVNIRHHQYVWDHFKMTLDRALKSIDTLSGTNRIKILSAIGGNDKCIPRPSDIRNKWNYREAAFFSSTGEKIASQYMKMVKSYKSTSGWFEKSKTTNDTGQLACGISFLCHSLKEAIEKTKPYIIK
jgi:hypothetical protein